jgi:cellulose synthase/poly-beta-1,6-N-acetylglucosamine synthase-like glycosyltransferase
MQSLTQNLTTTSPAGNVQKGSKPGVHADFRRKRTGTFTNQRKSAGNQSDFPARQDRMEANLFVFRTPDMRCHEVGTMVILSTVVPHFSHIFQGVISLIFLCISVVYLCIIFRLIPGIKKLKSPARSALIPVTKVSIIIPARNEEENIALCLADIANQDYPGELLEVIVIDDHSTDNTASVVNNFAGRHPEMKITLIPNNQPEKHKAYKKEAIRLAISASSGDLIITTDADTRSDKGWISSIVGFYEKEHPEMILGPVMFHEEKSLFEKLAGMEFLGLMAVTAGSCASGFPLMCNGANLAYTRKAWNGTQDVQDDLKYPSGDDLFLLIRIRKKYGNPGVKYLFSEEAIVRTNAVKSPGLFIQQRLRWVSKSRGYSDFFVTGTAIITYLFNLFLAGFLIAGIFSLDALLIFAIFFGCKLVAEFYPVYKMAGFYRKRKLLVLYPFAQFLNLFYVTLIGLLGNVMPYEWKGRKVTPF